MKQGQCLMWSKRKYSMSSSFDSPPNNSSSYDENSWEEQAFAKDAAWSGCIWPPRSYSCSFCRREFRSAQALGGHMNVHRRDRARLKQPYSPQNNETTSDDLEKTQPQNQVQISFTSLGYLYPSSICGLAHNTNPNSDPYSHHVPATPSNKVLATSVNKSCREKTQNFQLYNNSSIFKESHESSPALLSKSWSNLTEDFRFCSSRLDPEVDDAEKKLKGDIGKSNTDVAMSLNLFMTEVHSSMQFETTENDKSFKKRKAEASSIPIFTKSCSVDTHHLKSQVFEFNPSSREELDLELRLGCRSKV